MRHELGRAGAAALILALAAGCGSVVSVENEDEEPRGVALKAVHCTFAQEGTQRIDVKGEDKLSDLCGHFDAWELSGASNLFLARGMTAADAAEAAKGVFRWGCDVKRPSPWHGALGQPYWLVVQLGRAAPEPAAWRVESVTRTGKKVRVVAPRSPKAKAGGEGDVLYLAWVPLGHLEDGTYALELRQREDEESLFVRRVVTQNKGHRD